jgi:hypothetical protein
VSGLLCTRTGCSLPAARALLNGFGWVRLECAGHLGLPGSPTPDLSRLLLAPADALPALRAASRRPADLPEGTETVAVPLELVLAALVMGS